MTAGSPADHPRRWFVLMLAVSLFVAVPAIDAPYFSDDFQFVFESPSLNPAHYFVWHNPHNGFYRPIQSAFLAAVQRGVGLRTWPIHAVQTVLHAALAMLVFNVVLGLGFGRREATLASLLVAVSQAAVMAVSSNDSLSQLLAVLAGYLAAWAFYRSAGDAPPGSRFGGRLYLAGIAWLAVSLFSKETGVAFVALAFVALLAGTGVRRPGVLALRAAPLVVVLAAYVAARTAVATVAPEIGTGDYQIGLGANLVKDAVLLWVAATIPFSSVDLFTAVSAGNRAVMGALGALYGAFAVVVAAGLWRRRRDARLWWLAVAALASVTSIVPVNHVSELYSYQLLPVAAVIVAVGIGALAPAAGRSRVLGVAWIAVVAAVLASGTLAAHAKTRMLAGNARRCEALLDAVVPYARSLPPGGELVLANPASDEHEYSMFRMTGFSPLRHADFYIARRAGRDDVSVRVASAGEPGADPGPGRTVLTLDRGTVTPLGLPRSGRR